MLIYERLSGTIQQVANFMDHKAAREHYCVKENEWAETRHDAATSSRAELGFILNIPPDRPEISILRPFN